MSQQWLFKDSGQAQQEYTKKINILDTGILVLNEQTVYHFEDKKEWDNWQTELLKKIGGNYAWTNLVPWKEWVKERDIAWDKPK